MITIAHPEQSSGKLKKRPARDLSIDAYAMFFLLLIFFIKSYVVDYHLTS